MLVAINSYILREAWWMLMHRIGLWIWFLFGLGLFWAGRFYAVSLRGNTAWGGELVLLWLIPVGMCWLGRERKR